MLKKKKREPRISKHFLLSTIRYDTMLHRGTLGQSASKQRMFLFHPRQEQARASKKELACLEGVGNSVLGTGTIHVSNNTSRLACLPRIGRTHQTPPAPPGVPNRTRPHRTTPHLYNNENGGKKCDVPKHVSIFSIPVPPCSKAWP